MHIFQKPRFEDNILDILHGFAEIADPVDVGQWQSTDIRGDRSKVTWELREAILAFKMPESIDQAQHDIRPNLPWAEDHFLERVGGEPLNPPPSQAWWPFAQQGHKDHLKEGKFSHTYPERFWPKLAGKLLECGCFESCCCIGEDCRGWCVDLVKRREGIRFEYGDLDDVVRRLSDNILTRQAYLPIWFPEDTGAPEGERVPCTLGYHFLVRAGKLHMTYHIRSCDFMRHWRDDVYMAVRLAQWVSCQIGILEHQLEMGDLTMHIGSFHIFEGDRRMVRYQLKQARQEATEKLMRGLG
ncbi:thymidylate synthase [Streptomyces sp. NPDC002248]